MKPRGCQVVGSQGETDRAPEIADMDFGAATRSCDETAGEVGWSGVGWFLNSLCFLHFGFLGARVKMSRQPTTRLLFEFVQYC